MSKNFEKRPAIGQAKSVEEINEFINTDKIKISFISRAKYLAIKAGKKIFLNIKSKG